MIGGPQVSGVRYHNGSNGAQSSNNLSSFVQPSQMCVAGGKKPIRVWMMRIVLNGHEQSWYRLFKAPADEMRDAEQMERRANASAWAEAQRRFEVFNRGIGLTC